MVEELLTMVGELITMVKGSIDGLQEQWLGSKVMPTPTPAVARPLLFVVGLLLMGGPVV